MDPAPGAVQASIKETKGDLEKLLKSALQKNVRLCRPGPTKACFRALLEVRPPRLSLGISLRLSLPRCMRGCLYGIFRGVPWALRAPGC